MATIKQTVVLDAKTKAYIQAMEDAKKASVEFNKILLRTAKGTQNLRAATAYKLNTLKKSASSYTSINNHMLRLRKTMAATSETTKSFGRSIRGTQGVMLGLTLSMMFMGMAIKRTFTNILRTTLSTFNRIMQESGFFGTAVQRLGVHWEYLKFVIGSTINRALEPLMPFIIKLINGFAAMVQAHPEETFRAIVGILSGAALLQIMGQFGTFLTGLSTFKLAGGFKTLASSGFLGALGGLLTKGIGIGFFFKGVKETWEAFKEENILNGIRGVLSAAGGGAIFFGHGKLGGAAIGIVAAIDLIQGIFAKDGAQIKDAIASAFIAAGVALPIGPLAKGALIVIGVSLKFIDVEHAKIIGKKILEVIFPPLAAFKSLKSGYEMIKGERPVFTPLKSKSDNIETKAINIEPNAINLTVNTTQNVSGETLVGEVSTEIGRLGNLTGI